MLEGHSRPSSSFLLLKAFVSYFVPDNESTLRILASEAGKAKRNWRTTRWFTGTPFLSQLLMLFRLP